MNNNIYLYRFLGFILLSMFLALAFGPYRGNPFSKPYDFQNTQTIHRYKSELFSKDLIQGKGALTGQEPGVDNILQKPAITILRFIFAVIFLSAGITAMSKVYKPGPGIKLNPLWSQVIIDCISVIFLSFFVFCIYELIFKKITAISLYLYDSTAMWIVTISYLPVAALLVIIANQFGQCLEVNEKEIVVHVSGTTQAISWKDVKSLDLKSTSIFNGKTEFPALRTLQTKLIIHGHHGKTIELTEPGLRKTKRRILQKFNENAPAQLKNKIAQLMEKW